MSKKKYMVCDAKQPPFLHGSINLLVPIKPP